MEKNTLKEVTAYYLYLRMAQWYTTWHTTEEHRMTGNTIAEFNFRNNFNRAKSAIMLFVMCTASLDRARMFELFSFKATRSEPWLSETTLPMEWNTPLMLDEKHSIEWHLFGIKIMEDGLFSEDPSTITTILSRYLDEENSKEFLVLANEIAKTFTKLRVERQLSDLVLHDSQSLYYLLCKHSSFRTFSAEPLCKEVIPKYFLKKEKSTLGSGNYFAFS